MEMTFFIIVTIFSVVCLFISEIERGFIYTMYNTSTVIHDNVAVDTQHMVELCNNFVFQLGESTESTSVEQNVPRWKKDASLVERQRKNAEVLMKGMTPQGLDYTAESLDPERLDNVADEENIDNDEKYRDHYDLGEHWSSEEMALFDRLNFVHLLTVGGKLICADERYDLFKRVIEYSANLMVPTTERELMRAMYGFGLLSITQEISPVDYLDVVYRDLTQGGRLDSTTSLGRYCVQLKNQVWLSILEDLYKRGILVKESEVSWNALNNSEKKKSKGSAGSIAGQTHSTKSTNSAESKNGTETTKSTNSTGSANSTKVTNVPNIENVSSLKENMDDSGYMSRLISLVGPKGRQVLGRKECKKYEGVLKVFGELKEATALKEIDARLVAYYKSVGTPLEKHRERLSYDPYGYLIEVFDATERKEKNDDGQFVIRYYTTEEEGRFLRSLEKNVLIPVVQHFIDSGYILGKLRRTDKSISGTYHWLLEEPEVAKEHEKRSKAMRLNKSSVDKEADSVEQQVKDAKMLQEGMSSKVLDNLAESLDTEVLESDPEGDEEYLFEEEVVPVEDLKDTLVINKGHKEVAMEEDPFSRSIRVLDQYKKNLVKQGTKRKRSYEKVDSKRGKRYTNQVCIEMRSTLNPNQYVASMMHGDYNINYAYYLRKGMKHHCFVFCLKRAIIPEEYDWSWDHKGKVCPQTISRDSELIGEIKYEGDYYEVDPRDDVVIRKETMTSPMHIMTECDEAWKDF